METGKQVEYNRVFCLSAFALGLSQRWCQLATGALGQRPGVSDLLKALEMPFLTLQALDPELGLAVKWPEAWHTRLQLPDRALTGSPRPWTSSLGS